MNLQEFTQLINPQYLESTGDQGNVSFLATFDRISVEGIFGEDCQLVSLMLRDWDCKNFYKFGPMPNDHAEFVGSDGRYVNTTLKDMIIKIKAVIQGIPYSTDVDIELEMTDDEWYHLMKTAHQKNVTLNQLVSQILERHIKHVEKNS